jgi:hypothetical protein
MLQSLLRHVTKPVFVAIELLLSALVMDLPGQPG